MPHFDLILKNGTLVSNTTQTQADIGVVRGKIKQIGNLKAQDATEVVDCTGLHILPGVIDSQVHFREPGLEHKEDLESGSRAAVMGGVCTVFEMPNTNPLTITPELLEDKLKRAQGRMHSNYAFWFGGTAENAATLGACENLKGTPGIKIFMGSSTGSLLVADDDSVRAVLSQTKRRVAVHAEDEFRLNERKALREDNNPKTHPIWRDEEVVVQAVKRLSAIARETGAQIHVLHITSAGEIEFLRHNKDIATLEVTPNHLTLHAPDCYERLGTYAQMNPPVRTKEHQEALWRALNEGIIDVLGSDHAPHTREEKDKPYPNSPSGMTGVQTLVPIMLNHVHEGRLSLNKFVELSSFNVAKLFKIQGKGQIAIGFDADFTIVDLKKKQTIENSWIESKCGWTPFDGFQVTGWPVGTIVCGQCVMMDGELVGPNLGQCVTFEAL